MLIKKKVCFKELAHRILWLEILKFVGQDSRLEIQKEFKCCNLEAELLLPFIKLNFYP